MYIIETLQQMFSYSFLVRGMIVGMIVAVCASLLGVILVLKKYSMIGDGLSHVSFGAMAIGLAFGFAPIKVAIPVTIIAAFLMLRISDNSKINGDAAIALSSSSFLAIGIIMNSVVTGTSIDLNSYMFGSILAISNEDMWICIVLGIIIAVAFLFFYHYIFAITFDENFAAATGVKVQLYKTVLSVLTALTVVIGMRIMGTLLISSLIIFPALSSLMVFKRFRQVMVGAVIISFVSFFVGMVCSYMFSIPTGASIVVVNLIVFIIMSLIGNIKK